MEAFVAIFIGILFACSIYLLQTRSILRVVLGTVFVTHAANLLIINAGLLKRGGPPILEGHGPQAVVDPLPQALILTAIVIGFGVTSLLLVVAYRAVRTNGTDDLSELRGVEEELTEVAHD